MASESALDSKPGTWAESGASAAWMVLAAMVALNGVKYVHRQAPYALLPFIQKDMALTDFQSGMLASAFMLAYIAAALPFGWLASLGARQGWIAWPSAIWSLAVTGTGLCPGLGSLLAARAATGAAQAGFGSAAPSFVAEHHPGERKALALALYSAAVPLGSALGYVLSGRLGALWGWRAALVVIGLPGLLFAAAARFLPDSPPGCSPRDGKRDAGLRPWAAYWALSRIRSFTACTFAMALTTFALGGFAVWMPTFFVRYRGFEVAKAGYLFGGVTAAAGLLGIVLGGVLSERLAKRSGKPLFLLSGWGMLAALPLGMGALAAPDLRAATALLFAAQMLVFLYMGPLNAVVASVVGPEARPLAFAANVFVLHSFGDAVSPSLIGAASDAWGLRCALGLALLLLAPAAGLCFWGAKHYDQDTQAA
ncbi:MAG: MFS transporter [Elusimicrobia bacterium]|nr:MFS transporter [Elusimicrobiota bacterium]